MNSFTKLQKFQKIFTGAALAAIWLLPISVWAAVTDFKSLVNAIITNINYLITLVVGLAVFVFIWGIFKYFVAGADEKKVEEARNVLVFGLLGIFIMLSVWGLVNILIKTFDFGTTTQPSPPQFTPNP